MDANVFPAFRQFLGKYRYVFLVLLLGIALMLLPEGGKNTEQPQLATETKAQPLTLQEQLSQLLSSMEGAGKVQVLLTTAKGEKTIFQTESDTSSDERSDTSKEKTVLVTDSSRNQTGLVTQTDPPTYLGAVVLCQGAEDSRIRLAITEAVSNATGLGYHKITILKMK